MIGQGPIRDEDLHAFIDGELPGARAAQVAAALRIDPALAARVAAFAADKAALAAAFRPELDEPVPADWIARIERATARPPAHRAVSRRAVWATALAACVVLAIGGAWLVRPDRARADELLAQAEAARQGHSIPLTRLVGAALADAPARDTLLTNAVGLKLRAPDLAALGWHLAEIDIYKSAAALRYRAGGGRAVMLFIRRSIGAPRFEMLKTGTVQTCIWQDEEQAAVMMGEISAGQMMHVASAAYNAL